MKFKSLMFVPALGLIAGGFLAATAAGTADARELKLAHFMPPVHHNHRNVFVPFAKEVAERSGGDLTIKIFPAGQLGPGPFDQYKRAVEGVTDIAFICHSFNPNIFRKGLLTVQMGTARTAVQATTNYYNSLELMTDEYKDVHLLAFWSVAPTIVVSRERPVRSVDDLAGAKIAIGGPAFSNVLEAWGAEAV
ncbi:MAG: hypothetical protein O7C63_04930, partial [Alphaproteobacteria bacterium]|nr:hypothetical protein [Alphaproteobacteria bacterium]